MPEPHQETANQDRVPFGARWTSFFSQREEQVFLLLTLVIGAIVGAVGGGRRDVEDITNALFVDEPTAQLDERYHVELDHLGIARPITVDKRPEVAEPDVVDDNVKLLKPLNRFRDESLVFGRFADINAHGQRFSAGSDRTIERPIDIVDEDMKGVGPAWL